MIYSPGTWRDVNELKLNFDNFTESLADFLDSDDCPESVQFMLKLAKVQFDNSINKQKQKLQAQDCHELNFSQSTEGSQVSQDDFDHLTFGNSLLRDIALKHKLNINDAEAEEDVLYNGGENYDWHTHSLHLLGVEALTSDEIELTKGWLDKVCSESDKIFEESSTNCTLPDVNPRLVNKMQMIVVYYNLKHLFGFANGITKLGYQNCKRLIIQGVAGTGKSQIIKILTRLVRRIFVSNKAILNVAPTGGAAAVLLPDGGFC